MVMVFQHYKCIQYHSTVHLKMVKMANSGAVQEKEGGRGSMHM
jgi:hypothetical protein